ncbi:MAG: hypothetical protein ACE5NG_08375, partial [bacterium]
MNTFFVKYEIRYASEFKNLQQSIDFKVLFAIFSISENNQNIGQIGVRKLRSTKQSQYSLASVDMNNMEALVS